VPPFCGVADAGFLLWISLFSSHAWLRLTVQLSPAQFTSPVVPCVPSPRRFVFPSRVWPRAGMSERCWLFLLCLFPRLPYSACLTQSSLSAKAIVAVDDGGDPGLCPRNTNSSGPTRDVFIHPRM